LLGAAEDAALTCCVADDEADDAWDVAADDEVVAVCAADVSAAELVVATCDDGAALVVAADGLAVVPTALVLDPVAAAPPPQAASKAAPAMPNTAFALLAKRTRRVKFCVMSHPSLASRQTRSSQSGHITVWQCCQDPSSWASGAYVGRAGV